jgi:hypothetical protein
MSTSVRRRLATQLPPAVHLESPDALLTTAEVCLRLRISRKTLQRITNGEKAKPARPALAGKPARAYVPAKPALLSCVRGRGGIKYRLGAVEAYIARYTRLGLADAAQPHSTESNARRMVAA